MDRNYAVGYTIDQYLQTESSHRICLYFVMQILSDIVAF